MPSLLLLYLSDVINYYVQFIFNQVLLTTGNVVVNLELCLSWSNGTMLPNPSLTYFLWNRQPNREDIVNIVHRMYEKDGIPKDDVVRIVDEFPNQGN